MHRFRAGVKGTSRRVPHHFRRVFEGAVLMPYLYEKIKIELSGTPSDEKRTSALLMPIIKDCNPMIGSRAEILFPVYGTAFYCAAYTRPANQ